MAGDLTRLAQECPEWCLASDVKLLAWLKGFSNQVTERTQALNQRIEALSLETAVAQADLGNAFTSLQQLSNKQFIEQRIQEEDEVAPFSPPTNRTARPPIAPGPESFEQNVVPKYREAVHVAWQALQTEWSQSVYHPPETAPADTHGKGGSTSAASEAPLIGKNRMKTDWLDRPLPLILGTDAFLADEFCGLPPPDTEEYHPPETESYERQRREGHFAGPTEDQKPVPHEEGGGKGVDSQSEGGKVEDGWTQIGGRKEYSELEPAVSAALNFRAMLEEALRGPSSIYDDVSSPRARHTSNDAGSDSATSASLGDSFTSQIRAPQGGVNKGDVDSADGVNKGAGRSEAEFGKGVRGDATSVGGVWDPQAETAERLGTQESKGGMEAGQSRGHGSNQGKAKRVMFADEASEEGTRSVSDNEGPESENGTAESGEADSKGTKWPSRSLEDDWNDGEFSFGASTKEKAKPSYTLDLDDLFKRKPRSAPLSNGTSQPSGNHRDGSSQGLSTSESASNGLGAGLRAPKYGLGVGLGAKNAAVDAITAALKQRQAASHVPSGDATENRVNDGIIADWVEADGAGSSVSENPDSEPAGLKETARWSPSAADSPLRTEVSFGLVDDETAEAQAASRDERERNQGVNLDHNQKNDERVRMGGANGLAGAAINGSMGGIPQLRQAEAQPETGAAELSDSGGGRSSKFETSGEDGLDAEPGAKRSGDAGMSERRELEAGKAGIIGEHGGRTSGGSGRSELAEKRTSETSTSTAGGKDFRFGKGGARSRLFGDSDEDEDYGLPLFGGKLDRPSGKKRRGLFEDSDEEPGGLGFGRRGAGLFDSGWGSEKGSSGSQKRGTGLFGDGAGVTGGLFSGDRDRGREARSSGESLLGVSKSVAEGSPQRSATEAEAARKSDEGLFSGPIRKQTALSADLFGDDEEDGDLFGLSGLGRSSGAIRGAGESKSKKTSGVSALLEYSSDEEDPWAGRLAKLKENKA